MHSIFCSDECALEAAEFKSQGLMREAVRLEGGKRMDWFKWCKMWGQCPICLAKVNGCIRYERNNSTEGICLR